MPHIAATDALQERPCRELRGSYRFQVTVGKLSETGSGIGRRTRKDLNLHTVIVDEASHAQCRVGILIGVIAGVPDTVFNQSELCEQTLDIELKIRMTRIPVVASTDQFRAAKVQPDAPAALEQLAVKADPSNANEGFKQLGNFTDQIGNPGWTAVSLSATGSVGFDLLQQVIDGHMRVGQGVWPPVVIISIASFVDFVTVLLTDTDGPLPEQSPGLGHGDGHTAYRGIAVQRTTTNRLARTKHRDVGTIVRLGANIASVRCSQLDVVQRRGAYLRLWRLGPVEWLGPDGLAHRC